MVTFTKGGGCIVVPGHPQLPSRRQKKRGSPNPYFQQHKVPYTESESKKPTWMSIEIHKPELERMVHEEVQRGHFGSVDELLTEALQALREKAAAHERARGLASH